MKDDHLWNRKGPTDPDVERLEQELSRHRWSGRTPGFDAEGEPPVMPVRAREWGHPARWLAFAAALVAALVLARTWFAEEAAKGYRLEVLRGVPVVDGAAGVEMLEPGQRLVCGSGARARIRVGAIGSVVLESNTSLRVEEPAEGMDGAEYLLWLERGTLAASIFAEARLFQVGTPSGIAVDLGCVYEATVAEDGVTRLRVVSGQVSFETEGRRVTVPSGASTTAEPGRGPLTPVWDDAPESYRTAAWQLDQGEDAGLGVILGTDRSKDSLTLWHLLDHPDSDVRAAIYDRLAVLMPPPAEVTRQGCLAGDQDMLEAWKSQLGWSW